MPSIEVDFNDFDDSNRLGALLANADDPSALDVGTVVLLKDDDGNTAQGRVVEVGDRGQVWLDVLRSTWHNGPAETADQMITTALANADPPAWFFLLVTPPGNSPSAFGASMRADFYLSPLVVTVGGSLVRFQARTHGLTGWPSGLGFTDCYKLRSTSGVAPVTAELGP